MTAQDSDTEGPGRLETDDESGPVIEEVFDHDLQIATYHSITNEGDDEHDYFSHEMASPHVGSTPQLDSPHDGWTRIRASPH
eukprot:6727864-Karenia_brevis.AAC.1